MKYIHVRIRRVCSLHVCVMHIAVGIKLSLILTGSHCELGYVTKSYYA